MAGAASQFVLRAAQRTLDNSTQQHQALNHVMYAEDIVTTKDVPGPHPDSQPWTIVDVVSNSNGTKKWTVKARAFQQITKREAKRAAGFTVFQKHNSATLDALQKITSRGKEEQTEAATFLQQRAAADSAYGAALLKQRLGGKFVSELADLRSGGLPGRGSSRLPAIDDAAGSAEARTAISVLGCMMAQTAEKLRRFGDSASLSKEINVSLDKYSAAADQAITSFVGGVLGETRRLDASCVDAFNVLSNRFRAAEAAESVGDAGSSDLWISEFMYNAAVSSYGEQLWSARRRARTLLESFRAHEVARIAALSSALRVYAGLSQRVWADISASSASVHTLFAQDSASTGLSVQPLALALETIIDKSEKSPSGESTLGSNEYASMAVHSVSPLVLHEGELSYQRSVLRTWVQSFVVLTADGYIHVFSAPSAKTSIDLVADQLLFSLHLAADPSPSMKLDAGEAAFEVFTIAAGFLDKVGLRGAAVNSTTFRAPDSIAAAAWMRAVERVLRGDVTSNECGVDVPAVDLDGPTDHPACCESPRTAMGDLDASNFTRSIEDNFIPSHESSDKTEKSNVPDRGDGLSSQSSNGKCEEGGPFESKPSSSEPVEDDLPWLDFSTNGSPFFD